MATAPSDWLTTTCQKWARAIVGVRRRPRVSYVSIGPAAVLVGFTPSTYRSVGRDCFHGAGAKSLVRCGRTSTTIHYLQQNKMLHVVWASVVCIYFACEAPHSDTGGEEALTAVLVASTNGCSPLSNMSSGVRPSSELISVAARHEEIHLYRAQDCKADRTHLTFQVRYRCFHITANPNCLPLNTVP